MKNLKKILVALALVALLVSSVVTIALADASYTGRIGDAQALLEKAVNAVPTEELTLAEAKGEQLVNLYSYLSDSPVDPEADGYDELVAKYNDMTFKVAYVRLAELDRTLSEEDIAKELKEIYDYIGSAPLYDLKSSEAVIYLGYECKNDGCGASATFSLAELFNGITEDYECPGRCSNEDMKLELAQPYTYAQFEAALNEENLNVLGVFVESIFNSTYYDIFTTQEEAEEFVKNVLRLEYVAPTSELYNGKLEDVNGMLAALSADSTLDALMETLANVYSYLVATPVLPTTDDYLDFINAYNAYADLLCVRFEETVDNAVLPQDKIDLLVSFREYLVGKPAVEADPENNIEASEAVAGTQISENVVATFNKLREKVIGEFAAAKEEATDIPELVSGAPVLEYTGNFAEFKVKLELAAKLGVEDANLPFVLSEIYTLYISRCAFNPAGVAAEGGYTADEYEKAMAQYVELCVAYVNSVYVEKMNSLEQIGEKYTQLVYFNKFVRETPLCEEVVDTYNAAREALLEEAKALGEKISADNLPAYKAPEQPASTVTVYILESLYESLSNSYDKYIAAAAEDKAAALAEMKKAASEMHSYIIGSVINTNDSYYGDFTNAYKTLRRNIGKTLIAAVNDAETDEAKLTALKEAYDFFTATAPIFETVEEYNELVDETVANPAEAKELKLSSIYYDIYATVDLICGVDATLESKLADGITLQSLVDSVADITDPEYDESLVSYKRATEVIGNAIHADLIEAVNTLSVDEILSVVDYYVDYVEKVYSAQTVLGLKKALKSTADTCNAVINKIEKNYSDVAVIITAQSEVQGLIDAIDASEYIGDKISIYYVLSNKINGEYFSTEFMIGKTYAAVMAEYNRVTAELESTIKTYLDVTVSPLVLCTNLKYVHTYLQNVYISDDVIEAYNTARDLFVVNASEEDGETDVDKNDINFEQYTAELAEKCEVAVYKTPDGWTHNFTRILISLEKCLEAETVDDSFAVAYKIVSGYAGIDGPRVLDFGVSDYCDVIEEFHNTKDKISNRFISKIDIAGDTDKKLALLNEFASFIKRYPFSADMIEGYNSACDVIDADYVDISNSIFDTYTEKINTVHDYIETCPVKESALSAVSKNKYRAIEVLIEAAEYGEMQGYFDNFDILSGENVLVYQNQIADRLNQYANVYGLSDYNESMLATAHMQLLFDELLVKLDSDFSSLSASAKEREIEIMGNYFVNMGYPSDLIKLYNTKFGTELKAKDAISAEETGTVVDFGKYIENIYNNNTSATLMTIYMTQAVKYLNSNPLSSVDLRSGIEDSLAELNAKLAENVQNQKDELDKLVDLGEYDYPVLHSYKHEDGKIYRNGLSQNGSGTSQHTIQTDSKGNKYAEIKVFENKASYFDMKVTDTNTGFDDSNGLVIDLDLMSYDALNFQLAFTEDGLTTGNRVTLYALKFIDGQLQYIFGDRVSSKDDQGFPGYQEGVHDPIVVTPGEWVHITLVIDPAAWEMELLVDYVSLGRKTMLIGDGTTEDTCRFTALRFQNTTTHTATGYDNVTVYAGTAYRTLDKMVTMSTDAKFDYFVDIALDENNNAINRLYAYYAADGLRDFASSACAESKARFDAFDVNDIRTAAHLNHINNLKEIVNKIDIDALNSATVADIGSSIDAASAYIESNRLYIDQAAEEFVALNDVIVKANAKRAWLENLSLYLENLARFHRATSLASQNMHLAQLQIYFDLCELGKADKMAMAEADPAAAEFIDGVSQDAKVVSLVPNLTFSGYYYDYIPACMEAQLHYENSLKILDCIGFIELLVPNKDELTEDAYKAALLSKASENADYVDPYMVAIRSKVTANAYDASVEGIDEAIEIFALLDEMFFEALQNEHFEVIKTQLDRYTATNSYIEKAGICTFVENYITENEVDMSGALGIQYSYALQIYKSELAEYKKDYEAILAANTECFIGIVNKMDSYVTYAELKPLYDTAINNYYYSMNTDSEEVKAASAKFLEYEAMLQEWELNGAMLIGYAQTLDSDRIRQAQKFRALVNASCYIDKVDESVEGVAEAVEIYEKALASYNATIEPANSEISEVTDIVCSLRTNSLSATILATVKNIFSK